MKKLITTIFPLVWALTLSAMPNPTVSFSHLSTGDGLTSGSVTDFYFDENGIVWIGSGNGLCCYDGRHVTPFIFSGEGAHSNSVYRITGDRKGRIFVACRSEIYSMDLATSATRIISREGSRGIFFRNDSLYAISGNSLKRYSGDAGCEILHSLPDDGGTFTSLTVSRDGSFWAGTDRGRVMRLPDGMEWDAGSYVESIFEDSRGTVWAGTMSDGLVRIDGSGQAEHFRCGGPGSISSDFIRMICEDNYGKLWIGSYHGLNCYDPETGVFRAFHHDSSDPGSISNESVWQIKKDPQGTIWIGTFFGGVNYFNPGREIFTKYTDVGPEALSSPVIGKTEEAADGRIMVATEGGGLNLIDPCSGKTEYFNRKNGKLPDDNIKDFHYNAASGTIWVGTHLGGLCRLDPGTGKSVTIRLSATEGASKAADDILAVESGNNRIYVGTVDGLYSVDSGTLNIRRLKVTGNGDSVQELFLDSNRHLWISTGNRVLRYSTVSTKTETVMEDKGAHNIFQDSKGRIWICSSECGIRQYTLSDGKLKFISFKDALPPSEYPKCICESPASGNLFILCSSGLSEFNPETGELRFHGRKEGFPVTATNARALAISAGGTIYAGGINGLISCREEDLALPQMPYRLFFTKLFLDGRESSEEGTPVLQYRSGITVPAGTSLFSIEYSSSNYVPNNAADVEYLLEGFSREWTSTNGESRISYSNIPPGNYTLRIRPRGTAEYICPATGIGIRVEAPWYRSAAAKVLYLLLLLTAAALAIVFIRGRIKLRESLRYEKQHAEDIEELNQAKLRFFTNISHEIRTPLTIIISEIETLIQQHSFTPSQYSKVMAIYKNSLSLKELISELLEFRKQEQGEMKIRAAAHNIVFFINEFYLLFSEYASSKGVNLILEKETERLEVWYDQRQMQKVLGNILSNSLKFTKKGGSIKIRVFSEGSCAVIEVTDTGCGIKSSEIDKIFTRFYQGENSDTSNAGTGIGLALALGIVRMHGGDISVDSTPDKGSTFSISLPLGYSHFTKDQLEPVPEQERLAFTGLTPEEESIPEESIPVSKGHKIVIAEDNEEIRNMLSRLFAPIYEVFTAADGAEALRIVRRELPSIVISDVVMPEMAGTELCRAIKNDMSTCHIPVVLLTARVDIEQNKEGLLTGADDYITKPFNSALLISRCNNLVNSRILLQEKFSSQPQSSTWALATNKMDKEFIGRALDIINDNLDNADFNVSDFAKRMTLSRTGLFEKIKAITGQTPNDFILTIRLKESARLLKGNPELNVTEISERTGFSSARYFAKCFKNHYGITPLGYRRS